jgi:hypothetical protein
MCGLAFEARQPKEVDQQCSHRGVIVYYQDPPPSGLRVLTAAYHPSSPRMPQRTSCLSTGYQPRNARLCADQPSPCRLSCKTISRLSLPLGFAGARLDKVTWASHGPLTALARKALSQCTSNWLQALALSRPISSA